MSSSSPPPNHPTLTLLVEPEGVGDPEKHSVDVVVVHGLNGDYKKTWADGQEPPWISTALSKAVPKIKGFRQYPSVFDENVPIIFIGHCLGGVLIQELIWVANHDMDYLRIAARTRLLVLFGTPEVSGKEWDDVILKITLATTESEDCIPQRRDEYEILAICEGKPVPNLGYIGTKIFPGSSAPRKD
ncbi:hypothetical protein B9Z19DRAFT_81992 [Tuber borchii]|uniref:DUF676 domain-containing protein n=1 Tax=Tuber borchii TaxID=42251 RepID=A0A2T7A6S3_TUBBO|nr:hypothetical protein B9Z19DRAFT_81992 [Tuber borchii]